MIFKIIMLLFCLLNPSVSQDIEGLDSDVYTERQNNYDKLYNNPVYSFIPLYCKVNYGKYSTNTRVQCNRLLNVTFNRINQSVLRSYLLFTIINNEDIENDYELNNLTSYNVLEICEIFYEWGLFDRSEVDYYWRLANDISYNKSKVVVQAHTEFWNRVIFYRNICYERPFGG